MPARVARARAVAGLLLGRTCIYKDKLYLGPVQVEAASATYRWMRVTVLTKPWRRDQETRRFMMEVPVAGVTASAFSVTLDAGYGINAIFVHAPSAVAAIEDMYRRGRPVGELLAAVNWARGLPEEVGQLCHQEL